MMRASPFAVLVGAWCLFGCSTAAEVSWTVRFEDGGPRTGTRYRVEVREDCSSASPLSSWEVTEEEAAQTREIDRGRFGLFVTAVDRRCVAYAEGCAEVTPDSGRVTVDLAPVMRPLCSPDSCVLGRCGGAIDGGIDEGSDAGDPTPTDGGPTDGGALDGGTIDAGGPTDGGPCATPPNAIAAWSLAGGSLADVATTEPDAPLRRDPDRDPSTVVLEAGAATFLDGRLEVTQADGDALGDRVRATGSLTAEVWARPETETQSGPARIFTASAGCCERTFTLGHEGDDVVFRIHTSLTSGNGIDFNDGSGRATPQAFDLWVGTPRRHLVAVYDGDAGEARLYVDGVLEETVAHRDGSGTPGVIQWPDGVMRVGLGDEFGASRSWAGTIDAAAIYDAALTDAEAACLFEAGAP